jgi:diguanylate cyclase (GGDEF)-like protein
MKILAAEDNLIFQSMLRSMLSKWGYEVLTARDGVEAWEILQSKEAPRLAVLDWMMPGLDGVEVCRRLREGPQEPYTYVLLLTGRTDCQDLVEGMEAGADDYLTKPFNTLELRARLRAGRRIVQLQEELLAAREELRRQATHDGLTELLNRCAVLDVLHTELARSSRDHAPISILLADIDHFKAVNDAHGHQAGDAVLVEASVRMKSVIRTYDAIGRYGGEEFLVVLPGCAIEGAGAQAARLCSAFSGDPFVVDGQPLSVTCSIGYACHRGQEEKDSDHLIREADYALYQAKETGRNRAHASLPEMMAR